MNKKLLALILGGFIVVTGVGCGADTEVEEQTETPVETETQEETSGDVRTIQVETAYNPGSYETIVTTLTVDEDGNPVGINLDVRMDDGMKSDLAMSGAYVMVEGEEHNWAEQIDLLEQGIIENGFELFDFTDDEGHIDAVSGVTIKVGNFYDGVNDALAQLSDDYIGFTGNKTGYIDSDNGYRTIAVITYEDGVAVEVALEVITDDGKKTTLAANGDYVMVEGEEYHWGEQIEFLEEFIAENNFDLAAVEMDEETSTTDAISGVTIKVSSYLEVIQKILDEKK